ncbi:lasso peptide biosynthesis B2 protein [Actinocorallia sp. API 0066]|uniref:lasso peptide biosynthesis B2 protein n=1 Tax=Actinocorallia sp. API 0066 TaxID=2896846 RepID=UPI001E3E2B60|nr:lasso peptide biosynthesis B2 protein [Actinocorallia sp. API 0066]MCD0449564.1 lasso peptide biosynthesis B2 protein [Actinocorallia sp. API 0066]
MALELPPPVTRRSRAIARLAVALATPLSHLAPARLATVLRAARHKAPPASRDLAATARDAVVAVSAHCAGQGCLRRSIAAALYCRLHGAWPTWHVGVRTTPFRAHAWIEAQGTPVNEPFPPAYYTPILTVPPLTGLPKRGVRG